MEYNLGREITFVSLHEPLHLPGLGDMGQRLAQNEKKQQNIKMVNTPSGVFCTVGAVEFSVPWALTKVVLYSTLPSK